MDSKPKFTKRLSTLTSRIRSSPPPQSPVISEEAPRGLTTIPHELLLEILDFCDTFAIRSLSLVNRFFHGVTADHPKRDAATEQDFTHIDFPGVCPRCRLGSDGRLLKVFEKLVKDMDEEEKKRILGRVVLRIQGRLLPKFEGDVLYPGWNTGENIARCASSCKKSDLLLQEPGEENATKLEGFMAYVKDLRIIITVDFISPARRPSKKKLRLRTLQSLFQPDDLGECSTLPALNYILIPLRRAASRSSHCTLPRAQIKLQGLAIGLTRILPIMLKACCMRSLSCGQSIGESPSESAIFFNGVPECMIVTPEFLGVYSKKIPLGPGSCHCEDNGVQGGATRGRESVSWSVINRREDTSLEASSSGFFRKQMDLLSGRIPSKAKASQLAEARQWWNSQPIHFTPTKLEMPGPWHLRHFVPKLSLLHLEGVTVHYYGLSFFDMLERHRGRIILRDVRTSGHTWRHAFEEAAMSTRVRVAICELKGLSDSEGTYEEGVLRAWSRWLTRGLDREDEGDQIMEARWTEERG